MVKMLTRTLLPLLASLPLFLTSYAAPLEFDGTIEARDDDNVTAQWTWLHFEGCDRTQQQAIKDAHEDAVTMALHVENIDFANDPGAMDFFGPSALNKDWQSNIQSVFDHIGTFRLSDVWPGYKMNARCGAANDQKYQNRCNRQGVIAYQWNTKTDAANPNNAPRYDKYDALSNMHFCDQFFYYKNLGDAINDQKDSDNFKWRYDLTKYKNQGKSSSRPTLSFASQSLIVFFLASIHYSARDDARLGDDLQAEQQPPHYRPQHAHLRVHSEAR